MRFGMLIISKKGNVTLSSGHPKAESMSLNLARREYFTW